MRAFVLLLKIQLLGLFGINKALHADAARAKRTIGLVALAVVALVAIVAAYVVSVAETLVSAGFIEYVPLMAVLVGAVAGAVAALQAVADRHQVELEVLRSNEPSPVTDPRGEAFVRVERAIKAAWPGTEVLPFLLSGGTDTKHFVSLCPNCLRFTAYRISADQQVRCHAIDENIDLDTIPNGVDFFKNLIQGL